MNYEFTSDWFSCHSKKWMTLLSGFVGHPNVRYLEIGAYEGRSVIWMFEHVLTGQGASAVCIDVWNEPEVAKRFDDNVSHLAVEKRVGDSFTQLLDISDASSFDVIYVDGSHEARDVLADAVLAYNLLKAGGVLIFDDYLWDLRGMVEVLPKIAIDGFLRAYEPVVDVLERGYQVFLRKK